MLKRMVLELNTIQMDLFYMKDNLKTIIMMVGGKQILIKVNLGMDNLMDGVILEIKYNGIKDSFIVENFKELELCVVVIH